MRYFLDYRAEGNAEMAYISSANEAETRGINWRRGAFRLWIIASVLWFGAVFSVALLANRNGSGVPAYSPVVHVKISNTVTWDYPVEWGVQQIRYDLEKRLAAEDEKDREWAAQVPASRKSECDAISQQIRGFRTNPDDCVRLIFARDRRAVPSGWESQIVTAPTCKNGTSTCEPWERDWSNGGLLTPGSIVTEQGTIIQPNRRLARSGWETVGGATTWAIVPPLGVLALGASLFWALSGFQR